MENLLPENTEISYIDCQCLGTSSYIYCKQSNTRWWEGQGTRLQPEWDAWLKRFSNKLCTRKKEREAGLETHLAIKPSQEREALSGVFGLLI